MPLLIFVTSFGDLNGNITIKQLPSHVFLFDYRQPELPLKEKMVSLSSILFALSSAITEFASPLNLILEAEAANEGKLTARSTFAGTDKNRGFFYSFWTDGQGSVTYSNGVCLLHTQLSARNMSF